MLSTHLRRGEKHVAHFFKHVWTDNFLMDRSNQGITKPLLDLYIEMLPRSLLLVWASAIRLSQPAGETSNSRVTPYLGQRGGGIKSPEECVIAVISLADSFMILL